MGSKTPDAGLGFHELLLDALTLLLAVRHIRRGLDLRLLTGLRIILKVS